MIFDKHASGILVDPLGIQQELEAALPGISSDEVDAEGIAFLERLGVTQYRAFEAWFKLYELPVDYPPNLMSWPEVIPIPSDEPSGDCKRVELCTTSESVIEQLVAQPG